MRNPIKIPKFKHRLIYYDDDIDEFHVDNPKLYGYVFLVKDYNKIVMALQAMNNFIKDHKCK